MHIVSCHSLHGPAVEPHNQPLVRTSDSQALHLCSASRDADKRGQVLIRHRASQEAFDKAETVLRCLGSQHVYLSAHEHDRITADTQAVTHAAFLSMGSAWHATSQYPWEGARYVGGVENAKINLTLRIYAQKWHVYAGLAILNPQAKRQIEQYANSVTALFKLMLKGKANELRERVYKAKERVFGAPGRQTWDEKVLLRDEVLDQFSLRGKDAEGQVERVERLPNNHLSLLAMVDSWAELGIVPYDHIICSTPLFRLWLGVTETLYRHQDQLDEALRTAIEDRTFRSDDLEFTFAARAWSEAVSLGSFEGWRERFVRTQKFFEPRFAGNIEVGNAMIKAVLESIRH